MTDSLNRLKLFVVPQAQLRAFIPLMLKYSTGRGKPGWGKPEHRPIWWPEDLPWANVRSDARTEEQKQKVLGSDLQVLFVDTYTPIQWKFVADTYCVCIMLCVEKQPWTSW